MNILRKLPCPLSISLLALALAAPASAQQARGPEPEPEQAGAAPPAAQEQTQEGAEAQELEEIVVTGSLIPRTTNSGMSPVSVVTRTLDSYLERPQTMQRRRSSV